MEAIQMEQRNNPPTTQTSTQPEDALSLFFGTAKDMIARYTHCALCGANLHFTYATNFTQNIAQETAKCPECNVKVRQIVHRLQ